MEYSTEFHIYQINPRSGSFIDRFDFDTKLEAENELAYLKEHQPEYDYELHEVKLKVLYSRR